MEMNADHANKQAGEAAPTDPRKGRAISEDSPLMRAHRAAEAESAKAAAEGKAMSPEQIRAELGSLLCSVADHLGDMPVSDEWAAKTARRAWVMLEANDYFRASPAGSTGRAEPALTDLHAAIMNIPCRPSIKGLVDYETAYRHGHKDARHAAAELAALTGAPDPLRVALEGMVNVWRSMCITKHWDPGHVVEYEKALAALAALPSPLEKAPERPKITGGWSSGVVQGST
jgi:hypothetical protein